MNLFYLKNKIKSIYLFRLNGYLPLVIKLIIEFFSSYTWVWIKIIRISGLQFTLKLFTTKKLKLIDFQLNTPQLTINNHLIA